jgi:hypothetical protein
MRSGEATKQVGVATPAPTDRPIVKAGRLGPAPGGSQDLPD